MDNYNATPVSQPSVEPPSYSQYGGYPAAPNPNQPNSPPPSYGGSEYPAAAQPPYPAAAAAAAMQPPYPASSNSEPPYPMAYAGHQYPTAYDGPGYLTPYEAAGNPYKIVDGSDGPYRSAGTVGGATADDTRLIDGASGRDTTSEGNLDPYATAVNNAESGWMGNSFSDKNIRRAFIRKVFLILMAQLLVTVGLIALFIFCEPIRMWIQTTGVAFYFAAYIVFLITYIVLVCCPGVRRTYPANIICLAVFTLALSYMAATISCFHSTNVVLIAMAITTAVCLSLAVFAIQTRIDFTMCSGVLFALCIVLFCFGFAIIIGGAFVGYHQQYILQCVYSSLAALLFSLFLVYDIQMLMGGHKYELSPEEYIFGALQIYLDVVYLFLIILSLFGGRD